jgi:hypothetical protein
MAPRNTESRISKSALDCRMSQKLYLFQTLTEHYDGLSQWAWANEPEPMPYITVGIPPEQQYFLSFFIALSS